jgi:hypothetical protein
MTKTAMMVSVESDSLQPMSAAQIKFNQLTEQIKQQQHTIEQWRNVVEAVQQKIVGQLLPLYDELAGLQIQLIQQLETVLSVMRLNPRQQSQLIDVILLFANRVSDSRLTEAQSNWVEQVIERYSVGFQGEDIEAELDEHALNEQLRDALRQPVMDAYAVDVTDASADELAFWSKQLDADFGESQSWCQSQGPSRKRQHKSRSKAMKPTQEKTSQPDTEPAVEVLANKSLKLVYQRLAARLHPDREIDEAKKVKKTAMLQEVIYAYQQKDLMTLLNFQNKLTQNDVLSGASFPDEQLKLHNISLEKHSKQLDTELNTLRDQLAQDINSDVLFEPKQAVQWMNTHVKNTQYWIQSIQYALTHLNNKQEVKAFLQEFSDY